jgi:hypothetical protein
MEARLLSSSLWKTITSEAFCDQKEHSAANNLLVPAIQKRVPFVYPTTEMICRVSD